MALLAAYAHIPGIRPQPYPQALAAAGDVSEE
jgi:hypothetical protein